MCSIKIWRINSKPIYKLDNRRLKNLFSSLHKAFLSLNRHGLIISCTRPNQAWVTHTLTRACQSTPATSIDLQSQILMAKATAAPRHQCTTIMAFARGILKYQEQILQWMSKAWSQALWILKATSTITKRTNVLLSSKCMILASTSSSMLSSQMALVIWGMGLIHSQMQVWIWARRHTNNSFLCFNKSNPQFRGWIRSSRGFVSWVKATLVKSWNVKTIPISLSTQSRWPVTVLEIQMSRRSTCKRCKRSLLSASRQNVHILFDISTAGLKMTGSTLSWNCARSHSSKSNKKQKQKRNGRPRTRS